MRRSRPRSRPGRAEFRRGVLLRVRVCEACRLRRAVDPHHVVLEQELIRRGIDPDADLRCGMALCRECHDRHHSGGPGKIALRTLRDDSLDFAFEVLGPYAYDHLRRRYGGDDPRLESRLAA